MFKTECRHISTTRQKTQTKLTFATAKALDDLELMQISKSPGFLVFSPDPIKKGVEEAVKDIKLATDPGEQSPSKRLRGALYEFWYKHRQERMSWEDFYKAQMDQLINKIKSAT